MTLAYKVVQIISIYKIRSPKVWNMREDLLSGMVYMYVEKVVEDFIVLSCYSYHTKRL